MFGREFSDGTITGLFAIPVSRSTIAAAKLLIYLVWLLICSTALLAALLVFGLAFGLGPIPATVLPALGRQFILAILTGVIAMPVAWAATIGRSVLAGIAVAVGILVAAQIAVRRGSRSVVPVLSTSTLGNQRRHRCLGHPTHPPAAHRHRRRRRGDALLATPPTQPLNTALDSVREYRDLGA